MVVERACQRLEWDLAAQHCVVQGFGNVGGIAASELHSKGAACRCRLRHLGRGARGSGSPHPRPARLRRGARIAPGLRHRRRADHERGAARAAVRHPRAGGAGGPGARRQRAEPPLQARRGRSERPDIGRRRSHSRRARDPGAPETSPRTPGVDVDFERRRSPPLLYRDEIRRRLADKMSDAFDRVWNVSQVRGISLRDAALVAAIREVSAALEARGVYP